MKVSLQFVGLIRGFKFENPRKCIYDRLLFELERQGHDVDVYWHTYDKEFDDVFFTEFKDNLVSSAIDSDSDIQDIIMKRNVDKFKFPSNFTTEHRHGLFKYYYSIKRVNELQKQSGRKYDWVILTSPQLEPQKPIDVIEKLDRNFINFPGYASFGGHYDSFFMGSQENMEIVADMFEYSTLKYKQRDFHPETFLKIYLKEKQIKALDNLKIRFNRVRFDGSRVNH